MVVSLSIPVLHLINFKPKVLIKTPELVLDLEGGSNCLWRSGIKSLVPKSWSKWFLRLFDQIKSFIVIVFVFQVYLPHPALNFTPSLFPIKGVANKDDIYISTHDDTVMQL